MALQDDSVCCILLSCDDNDADGETKTWIDKLSSCLRAKKIEVNQLLVPLSRQDKAPTEQVAAIDGNYNGSSFCFWLCVVTDRLLHRHSSIVSVSRILSLLERQNKSDFRVLPVLLITASEATVVKERFSRLLPRLWDRKPIVATLEEENAQRVANMAYRVTQRDLVSDHLDEEGHRGCCCTRLQLATSDLCLDDVQLKGADVLWQSERSATVQRQKIGVLGVPVAPVKDATGKVKAYFVQRTVSSDLPRGSRIIKIDQETVDPENILNCLKHHPNGSVYLTVQYPTDCFERCLLQLNDCVSMIQNPSFLKQPMPRPQWLTKRITPRLPGHIRSVDIANSRRKECVLSVAEEVESRQDNSVRYLRPQSAVLDEPGGNSDKKPLPRAQFRRLEDYALECSEKPKIDVTELLELGSSEEGISREEYRLLHKFSLAHPDIFWGQLTEELKFYFEGDSKNIRVDSEPLRSFISSSGPKTEFLKEYKTNLCWNMLDRHVDNGLGERCALHFVPRIGDCISLTYEELLQRVCKVTQHLSTKVQLETGDRVLVFMPKSVERILIVLACFRLGAPVCVMYPDVSESSDHEELRRTVHKSKCTVFITSNAPIPQTDSLTMLDYLLQGISANDGTTGEDSVPCDLEKCLKRVVVWKDPVLPLNTTADVQRYRQQLVTISNEDIQKESGDSAPRRLVSGEHTLLLFSTSGSSGVPKMVEHTTAGYMVYTTVTCKYVLDFNLGDKGCQPKKTSDVCLAPADLGWAYGMSVGLCGALLNGGTTVQLQVSNPSSEELIKIVKDKKVTHLCTVPEMTRDFVKLAHMNVDEWKINNGSHLQVLSSSGTLFTTSLLQNIEEFLETTSVRLTDVWWQTETGCFMLGTPSKIPIKYNHDRRMLAFYGVDADIEKDPSICEDQHVKKHGELVIRKPWPGCFRGICSDNEKYEKMFKTGCYKTEDNAQMNLDETFQLLGRKDNIVLMTTPDKQKFMIHREQLGQLWGDAYKKKEPDKPFNRTVMVESAKCDSLLACIQKPNSADSHDEDGPNYVIDKSISDEMFEDVNEEVRNRGLPLAYKLPKIENVPDVEMNETRSGKLDMNQWKQNAERKIGRSRSLLSTSELIDS